MNTTPSNKKNRRGIAMTEYLIILAIVAVAAIAIVGLFGKQIKSVFTRNTSALGGNSQAVDTSIESSSKTKTKTDDFGTFTKEAKSGGK